MSWALHTRPGGLLRSLGASETFILQRDFVLRNQLKPSPALPPLFASILRLPVVESHRASAGMQASEPPPPQEPPRRFPEHPKQPPGGLQNPPGSIQEPLGPPRSPDRRFQTPSPEPPRTPPEPPRRLPGRPRTPARKSPGGRQEAFKRPRSSASRQSPSRRPSYRPRRGREAFTIIVLTLG